MAMRRGRAKDDGSRFQALITLMLAETVNADTFCKASGWSLKEVARKPPKVADFNKSRLENPIRNDAKLTT